MNTGYSILEGFVGRFLSSDHQLLPETVNQIHLIESAVLLVVFVFTLLVIFKFWRWISNRKVKILIFFLVLVIAVLLRLVSSERGFNTMLIFDSAHYTATASELLESGKLTCPLNKEEHPNSKAPGFSLLLAPVYLVFKDDLGAAVFLSFILGIFSLFLIYFLAKSIDNKQTALIATVLLAFSSLHIMYSMRIEPHVPTLFLTLCGALILVRFKNNKLLLCLAGFLFGFSAITRYLAVAFIPAALIYLALQVEQGRLCRLKNIGILLIGAAIPLIGLFYYQWREYGSPWLSSYSYWEYFTVTFQRPFSVDYAIGKFPNNTGSSNLLYYLISAGGVYNLSYTFVSERPDQLALAIFILVFALAGFVHFYKKDRPFFFFSGALFLFYYIFNSFFVVTESRLMLPVVPFLLMMSASGMGFCLKKLGSRTRALVLGVVLSALLGFLPFSYSFSHYPLVKNTLYNFIDMMVRELPAGSYLISDYNAVLFTHQLGRERDITIIGLSPNVMYANHIRYLKGKVLPPALTSAIEQPEMVCKLLEDGKLVYLSAFSEDYASDRGVLAKNFSLSQVTGSNGFELYRVTKCNIQ